MSHPTITDLRDPRHAYHHAPRGVWLKAGTRGHQTYPCRCELGRRCKPWVHGSAYCCPCAGRPDTDKVPAHCCARRAAEFGSLT